MKTNEQLAHKGSAFSRRDFLKVTGAGLSFALVFGAAGVKVLSAQGSSRLRERLKVALATLSPEHREVVELTFYQGCSYPEIAAITGVPVGTVKTRMFHAKKYLQPHLEREFREQGFAGETA